MPDRDRTHIDILRGKKDQVTATKLYMETGDHRKVAEVMGRKLKDVYHLVSDELDQELAVLRGATAEDLSAVQMHEYLSLKEKLQGWLSLEENGAEVSTKSKITLVKEIRGTLMAIDQHLEKTGVFVKREEIHFSWEEHGQKDPELQNLFLAMADYLRTGWDQVCPKCQKDIHVTTEPQGFFDYVNRKMRDKAFDKAQDAMWDEVEEEAVDVEEEVSDGSPEET